jgi:ACT domain-containing protein
MDLKIVSYEDYESLSKKVVELEKKMVELLSKSQVEKKKDFLSVKEFLEEVGISRTTFEKMRRECTPGKFRLNAVKRGGKLYVPSPERERYFTFK